MSDRIFSVNEVGGFIKQILDAEEFLHQIKITGEISGFGIVRSIAYFQLKDESAIMPCVLFDADKFFGFKDGDQVVLTGSPKFYVKGGKLSFNAIHMSYSGQGDLFKQFLEIKNKLEKEGLFSQNIKKQILPPYQRIGVVTSKTGAVIQDIINVATRRDKNTRIVLFPVKVQGEGSENEIVAGIKFFSNYNVDVVIVARGGGSLEDLKPFNTEIVARAIFDCEKPVISAIGHETDFTICDFVSDLRAPTPSAAAEIVTINFQEQKNKLNSMVKSFNNLLKNFTFNLENNFKNKYKLLKMNYEKFLSVKGNNLKNVINKFKYKANSFTENFSFNLSMISNTLEKLNPKAILKRGYAKITFKNKIVSSINDINSGDEINVELCDGSFISKILKKKENKNDI